MPTYTETWDEAKPAGSRGLSLGDDDIREFKRAVRERLATDHSMQSDESGVSTIGYHKKATMIKLTSNPTVVTDSIILFAKDDASSNVELFTIDDSGNVIQLTFAGALAGLGTDGWRTGDIIFSSNTNTPTGWTDISTTYDGKFLRISSGTALSTGGTDTHTHAAGTLGVASHTHTITAMGGSVVRIDDNSGGSDYDWANPTAHTHTIGSSSPAATGSTASANNVPAYVQTRCYQKN